MVLLAELGIGFVPCSPLGEGFLAGTITASASFDAGNGSAAPSLKTWAQPARQ